MKKVLFIASIASAFFVGEAIALRRANKRIDEIYNLNKLETSAYAAALIHITCDPQPATSAVALKKLTEELTFVAIARNNL